MSIPIKAWSFSSLETFCSCPRKYWAEQIAKIVPYVESEAQRVGTEMHKHFEMRLSLGRPLPDGMEMHEPLMAELEKGLGDSAQRPTIWTERKVGLTRSLKPCTFFDPNVWWRGVLDVHVVKPDGTAVIMDYKTGKPHSKMRQLHLFSMYGFIEGQTMVESAYYWTKTRTRTTIKLPSAHLPVILSGLVPDLTRYKEAFRDNVWPPTPNGLCKEYCGVTECEFHGKSQRRGG